jgi:uncharacterized protein
VRKRGEFAPFSTFFDMNEPVSSVSMKIQVGGLSEGGHDYVFEADGKSLNLGDGIAGVVRVTARLEKTGTQVFLDVATETVGVFPCDRCLALFQRKLSPRYRMTYVFDAEEAGQYDPAEVQVISPALTVIDITEDVRQTILLAVPLKLLCGEECRGLCPACGANWNSASCDCHEETSDARWEALRSLRGKN